MIVVIEHFFLRMLALLWLERRLASGPLRPETRAKLKKVQAELTEAYRSARAFFDGLRMCVGCEAGCCAGSFSRFNVYDRIAQEAAGIEVPPPADYRLYLFDSFRKNLAGKEKGWCSYFRPGYGCSLPVELRPAICVWWVCGRMKDCFNADRKLFVKRLRSRIDRLFWRFAVIVIRDDISWKLKFFLQRVRFLWQGLRSVGHGTTIGAFFTGVRFLRQRLLCVRETILYIRATDKPSTIEPPADIRITPVALDDPDALTKLLATGTGWSVRNFGRKGATAYLATFQGMPVAAGWLFEKSPLLTRLRMDHDVVYLGEFEVLPQFRGRGIYPAMLEAMCSDIRGRCARAYAETEPGNLASRRGLEKAGFCVAGRLRTVIVAGMLVRCRLTPWTS